MKIRPDCGDTGYMALYDDEGKKLALLFSRDAMNIAAVYDAAMARWKWLESDEAEKMNAHEWMMKRAELDLAVDAACERAEEVERG